MTRSFNYLCTLSHIASRLREVVSGHAALQILLKDVYSLVSQERTVSFVRCGISVLWWSEADNKPVVINLLEMAVVPLYICM